LKRCATQNHCFSANCKAGVDFSAFTTRLKAAPFQNKIKTRVFQNKPKPEPFQNKIKTSFLQPVKLRPFKTELLMEEFRRLTGDTTGIQDRLIRIPRNSRKFAADPFMKKRPDPRSRTGAAG
jgi:hypothetical protein